MNRPQDNSSRRRAELLYLARLYVIVDAQRPLKPWVRHIEELIQSGVDILQLRDKTTDDRQLLDRARELGRLIRGTGTLFIMNDRADLAALAEADGVHLGQDDMHPSEARAIIGRDALVGVSTHTIEQARRAVDDGAHYIGVGPVFPSTTKQFDGCLGGLALVESVCREIRLPTFAIGGIDVDSLPLVLETGCHRVAVSGAIRNARDPAAVVREMKQLLGADPPEASQSTGRLRQH
jgi:thiamine-phosphate pyrophosphorylase